MRKPSKTEPTVPEQDTSGRRRGDTALARAVALLSRREHSALELRRKLVQRGFDPAEVEQALSRLGDSGLQDDARFAESLARSRVNAGYGPQRLRAELAQHGLGEELARAAVDAQARGGNWTERALELARRRWPKGAGDARERRRLADFLLRRGFDLDTLRSVLDVLATEAAQQPE
jgi:regulatory protein